MKKTAKSPGKSSAKRGAAGSARAVRERPMPTEYDFSGGVRGKYAGRFAAGSNVVVLEPDVARAFPTAKAVNTALRRIIATTKPNRVEKRGRSSG